jgi:hypothetical protein
VLELNDREYELEENRFPDFPPPLRMPRGVGTGLALVNPFAGGGVVSSDEELSFVEELPSWFDAPEDESGGVGFIDTRIEAASSNCTC